MFRISRTTPAYYFTSVAHHRLEVFRTDKLKQVLCGALSEVGAKYIHLNPVRAGLAENPLEYRFSSAGQREGMAAEDESLLTDHLSIDWR